MTRPSARYVLPEFTERTSSGTGRWIRTRSCWRSGSSSSGTPIDDTSANDVMAQFMHLEHRTRTGTSRCTSTPPAARSARCRRSTTRCSSSPATWRRSAWARPARPPRCCWPRARRASGSRCRARAMVIHQPALTEPVQGQASDLAIQADELLRTRARLEEMLVRHTGRTPEQVQRGHRAGQDPRRATERGGVRPGGRDHPQPQGRAAAPGRGEPRDAAGTAAAARPDARRGRTDRPISRRGRPARPDQPGPRRRHLRGLRAAQALVDAGRPSCGTRWR